MAGENNIPLDPEIDPKKAAYLARTLPKRGIFPSLFTIFLTFLTLFTLFVAVSVLDFTGIIEVSPLLKPVLSGNRYFDDFLVNRALWHLPEKQRLDYLKNLHNNKVNQIMSQLREAENKNNFWQVKLNDQLEEVKTQKALLESNKSQFEIWKSGEEERLNTLNKEFNQRVANFNDKSLDQKLTQVLQAMDPDKMAETFNNISDDLLLVKYLSQLKPDKSAEVLNKMDEEKVGRILKKAHFLNPNLKVTPTPPENLSTPTP